MASVVTNAILEMQARAEPGALGPGLELVASDRAEIHQAAGMLSVQLDVDVGGAMMRLRAYAHASERGLTAVAADVVAGRLSFDERDA